MQNLNPRPDGLGSKYLRPLNMEYADQELEQEPVEDLVEAEEPVEEELDEERCGDNCPCTLISPAMELLDKEVERFTGYLVRKINREYAKKGESRFMTWIEVNAEDEKVILRESIDQITTMVCGLAGWNRSEFTDAIVEPLFYDLFIDVVKVVDDTRVDDPKKTLKEVTNSFQSEVTQLYRDKLKARGFNNA
jgi:hypothetical protein